MIIAVNTRLLLPGKLEGIGWFTHETLRRIVKAHPEHEFHFIFDRPFSKEFIFGENVKGHVLPPQARHPFLYKIWYDYSVPYLLKKIRADIFISPDAMLSLRTSIPQLIVIHDINFEHYPQDVPAVYTRFLKKRSPLFAHKAKRIVTVSEFSKKDIASHYKVEESKMDVVWNGVNEIFVALTQEAKEKTRQQFSGGHNYFVFVSSIHPRKNLQRLLPAFDAFKKQTGSNNKLVVVGQKFWFRKEIKEAYDNMEFKNDVVFTGPLELKSLHEVMASSRALVYPSYFEGFGIPVIEAFKCEVPVITSTASSLPEVAGDAAILIDPFSIESITSALIEVDKNESLRNSLIEKGRARVKQFTWDSSAEKLWASIEKTFN